MPVIADIRQIDRLCTVHLRRVNVNLLRQDKVGMLSFEIPERLAREAVENTRTQEEAAHYVMNKVETIELQWPDALDSGSTQITKCPGEERRRSN